MAEESLLTVRVPREDLNAFKAACRRCGKPMSEVIRGALAEFRRNCKSMKAKNDGVLPQEEAGPGATTETVGSPNIRS